MKNKVITYILCGLFLFHTSCVSKSGRREANSRTINTYSKNDEKGGYVAVKSIVDGDTFYIDDGSQKGVKVRLIGVDTPESRKTPKEDVQYYGKEAKVYLTELLKGKKVRVEYDIDKYDHYNRPLVYAYLEDGTFINADLVKKGYAEIMTIPPNVKYVDLFVRLQEEARSHNKGLWNNR